MLESFSLNNPSTWLGFGGIVATLISSLAFYLLSRRSLERQLASARSERRARALESLTQILERYIVEGRELTLALIRERIEALERRENVSLHDVIPVDLLQDLSLRFDATHYIGSADKARYIAAIATLANTPTDAVPSPRTRSSESEFELRRALGHYRFVALGLFSWFWIYNGLIGFLPEMIPNALEKYHWWFFGFGILVAISFRFSPFLLPAGGMASKGAARRIVQRDLPSSDAPDGASGASR